MHTLVVTCCNEHFHLVPKSRPDAVTLNLIKLASRVNFQDFFSVLTDLTLLVVQQKGI